MNYNIFLGLGSNLGQKGRNLKQALCLLQDIVSIDAVSKIYRSEAWGLKDQPRFINMALKVSTELSPSDLLESIKAIEQKMGRIKSIKWGPRIIDIDILLYDQMILDIPGLTIPHPWLSERDFVLAPLMDLEPERIHPLFKRSVSDIYQDFLRQQNG